MVYRWCRTMLFLFLLQCVALWGFPATFIAYFVSVKNLMDQCCSTQRLRNLVGEFGLEIGWPLFSCAWFFLQFVFFPRERNPLV